MYTQGVNKMLLVGNCANDPDVRYCPDGSCLTKATVATCEKWTDRKTGERKEKTEWHRVVFKDGHGKKLGERAGYNLSKGMKIYVEGRLKTSEWVEQGVRRSKTEIVASNFEWFAEEVEDIKKAPLGALAELI